MSEDKANSPDNWDEHYHLEKIQGMTTNLKSYSPSTPIDDEVFLHAYTTVNGRKDLRSRYKITLKEALSNWVSKNSRLRTKDTVQKVKKSVVNLLKHFNTYDIQLEEIIKRQIHDYIELLLATKAKTTTQGEISRLRSI
jgi:hypothetical protein